MENIVRRKMSANFVRKILSSEKCPAKNVSENFPENFVRRKKFGEISTCAEKILPYTNFDPHKLKPILEYLREGYILMEKLSDS
jgi:hypothetical protein